MLITLFVFRYLGLVASLRNDEGTSRGVSSPPDPPFPVCARRLPRPHYLLSVSVLLSPEEWTMRLQSTHNRARDDSIGAATPMGWDNPFPHRHSSAYGHQLLSKASRWISDHSRFPPPTHSRSLHLSVLHYGHHRHRRRAKQPQPTCSRCPGFLRL